MFNSLAIKTLSSIKAIKDRVETIEEGASSVEWVLIVAGIGGAVALLATAVTTWLGTKSTTITGR
jgi:Flp pilus assembly pilin Flp